MEAFHPLLLLRKVICGGKQGWQRWQRWQGSHRKIREA
jgi:hypothetical protein